MPQPTRTIAYRVHEASIALTDYLNAVVAGDRTANLRRSCLYDQPTLELAERMLAFGLLSADPMASYEGVLPCS